MKLKHLIAHHAQELTQKYGRSLLPSQRKALDAILACRSFCGEFYSHCEGCSYPTIRPLSCGHRSCPQCQQHLAEAWQIRQQDKLLPTNYFMVTLTIPFELRQTTYQHQSIMYNILFRAAVEALQTIAENNFQIKIGLTAVLHTHKRDKGYHPHLHIVFPGGGLTTHKNKRMSWKVLPEKFFINEFSLAKVFKGILLRLMFEQAIPLPTGIPKQWVANIRNVGRGEKALKYLSRYLYRGVISENDILCDQQGDVTFRYQESRSKKLVTKKEPAVDFIVHLLKHVLPRGFRRVRDYGFLHGNAKNTLKKIQLMLRVKLPTKIVIIKHPQCTLCSSDMIIDLVLPKRIPMIFRFYSFATNKKIETFMPT